MFVPNLHSAMAIFVLTGKARLLTTLLSRAGASSKHKNLKVDLFTRIFSYYHPS